MKISQEMYKKMCWCNDMQNKIAQVLEQIENYLKDKDVNIYIIRDNDVGGYVDMVDYGRGCISKEELEQLFSKYLIKSKD
jgi:Glu-tRNA(Gln) amidotransferase subunit E-like FAD-binding protein